MSKCASNFPDFGFALGMDTAAFAVAARFLAGVLSLIVSKIVRRGFLRDWD